MLAAVAGTGLASAPLAAATGPLPITDRIEMAQAAYRDCIAASVAKAKPAREEEAILAAALAKCRPAESALRRISAQAAGHSAADTLALVLDARIAGAEAGAAKVAAR